MEIVGAVDACVVWPAGAVPVEDLFVPWEEGVDGVAGLGDLAGAVDVREPVQGGLRAVAVAGEIEAVQLAERVPGCLKPWMGGEQRVEARPLGRAELVGPCHEHEPGPEHLGVERRLGAFGAALGRLGALR